MIEGLSLIHIGNPALQAARMQQIIVRQEFEILSQSNFQTACPVTLRAKIALFTQVDQPGIRETFYDGGRIVGRTVVDHNQLEVNKALRKHRLDGRADSCSTSVCGDAN